MTHAELQTPEFDRVRSKSGARINERLDNEMRDRLYYLCIQGPEEIRRRMAEIDREWDIDRAIFALFPVVGGVTQALGQRGHRGFTALFRVQLGFLFLHAVAGWCPPVPVLRRLGFRTRQELEAEKRALGRMLEARAH